MKSLVQNNLGHKFRYNFKLTDKKLYKKYYYGINGYCYEFNKNNTFIFDSYARPFIFYNLTKRKKLWNKFKRMFK